MWHSEKKLWSKDDDVMEDRGFATTTTTKKQFEPLGVSLNSPSILGGKDQFS